MRIPFLLVGSKQVPIPGIFASHGRCHWVMLLAGMAISLTGCSKDMACRVSGKVTLDNAPLTSGLIMFLPDKTDPSLKTVSALIENGQFEVEPSKGLWPGKYRVAVTSEQASGKKIEADLGTGVMIDEFVQIIPSMYNAESKLKVDIDGDLDGLEFALTRK